MLPNEHAIERLRRGLPEETPHLPFEVVVKTNEGTKVTVAAFGNKVDADKYARANYKRNIVEVLRCP